MQLGKLLFAPISDQLELVPPPVQHAVADPELAQSVFVTEIDISLADTAAFCEAYNIGQDMSTNCLVVQAKRSDRVWYAACLVMATDFADVNSTIRKHLGASKISFAPMETAHELTGMQSGGITPVGLPADWPILIDEAVLAHDIVVIGGGLRGSKIAIKTSALANLPNATVMKLTKS
jgi:prolyl-tRNA editing enzyme YbaK/EbsC (Cys-tRNA(Pro) deacylase)